MAEVFGTIAGVFSVAALFNNCVDSFEYIQLGRHFGRDFERCQLKFDIARTRLSRWGNAIQINKDPRFDIATPSDRDSKQVRAILEQIEQAFQTVQRSSKRYEIDATSEDLVCYKVADMQSTGRSLHNRLAAVITQRQTQTSLVKKATWALYDAKNFDKLIDEVTGFIDDLEKLFPIQTVRRQLAELEIEEIDKSGLQVLQGAAVGIDRVLAEVISQKIEVMGGRNRTGNIQTMNSSRVRVGDQWSSDAMTRGTGIVSHVLNEAGSVDARDTSKVHIGQSYGGHDIFDN